MKRGLGLQPSHQQRAHAIIEGERESQAHRDGSVNKGLAARPEDLSLIPGWTHKVEESTDSYKLPSALLLHVVF